jgi:hypothetical protein
MRAKSNSSSPAQRYVHAGAQRSEFPPVIHIAPSQFETEFIAAARTCAAAELSLERHPENASFGTNNI